MNELETVVNSTDKGNIFLFIVACLVGFQLLLKLLDYYKDKFGIETKFTRREKYQTDTIKNLEDEFKEIKTDEDDIKICLNNLKKDLEDVQSKLVEIQNKQDQSNRSRIRDRLVQGHRYYLPKGHWNEMEKEAFFSMVETYIAAGGNSFIQDKIVPDALQWEVIDDYATAQTQ